MYNQEYRKEYYKKNKKKELERNKLWAVKNKKSINKSECSNRKVWRQRTFDLLGGQFCKKCGFSDYRALQIDHILGGGVKSFKNNWRLRKPKYYFEVISKNPEQYQVLCANCNWIKRFENNEIKSNKEIHG